ncbi:hypothetical protein NSP_50370 [Nodularia spumigena CCY9414]|nr:hypothetical protein NSP_50370 [Nodularia spumigena CCY9414]
MGFFYLTQPRTAITVNLFNLVTYLASCNEAMTSCGELTCSPILAVQQHKINNWHRDGRIENKA